MLVLQDYDIGGLLLHRKLLRADHDHGGLHRGSSTAVAELKQLRCPNCFIGGLDDVRLLLPRDHESSVSHPHALTPVVLCVHRDDAGRADHHMVNVRVALAHWYRVQHDPLGAELRQQLADSDLAQGSQIPRLGGKPER